MKKISFFILSILFISVTTFAQNASKKHQKGHTNKSKFRQLTDELPTPNNSHTASGAPGHAYTQQKVDYVMDIRINEDKRHLYGNEAITYHNNSKDHLEYLWVQLDQNMRAPNSKTPLVRSESLDDEAFNGPITFTKKNLQKPKQYGYTIEAVTFENGEPLSHMINRTMMRINLPKALAPGENFKFKIKWNYLINNHIEDGGRSGYEYFPKDGNSTFVIAQFFPRLCVYDNVEGWQNRQFWGRSEFALEFGDYEVKITVPADHLVEATGELQNEKEVLTRTQRKRMKAARKSYKDPVFIVTQKEAEAAEKKRSKKTKTWHYKAKNVRDYAFATSRKFLWDAMAVKIGGKNIMAMSLYSKEGNPLWEEHSTRVVANTLEEYSKLTFDYPYSKAVSVHAQMGMEYPMICFNYGRPNPDGTYSARLKRGMIGVITHEVGHNFFPMIVNSDERQWTWMDEGLNSFVETLAELDYDPNFFTGNLPKDIVPYMRGDQSNLSPIMTQGEAVKQFGPNAYTKPAAGLYMLRQTIMGPKLFDFAFRTYARRWMFKHPTPADFFRTMEDASAMNLDWFWRGWFYTTDYTDIGIKKVKQFYLTDKPTEKAKKLAKRYNMDLSQYVNKLIYFEEGISKEITKKVMDFEVIKQHLAKMTPAERETLKKVPNYFYEVTFEKPGGLVMPIIVELEYENGTKERKTYPAQIWIKNDAEVKKVYKTTQKIKSIKIDPDLETADVDTSNNSWPRKKNSKFNTFKKKTKG